MSREATVLQKRYTRNVQSFHAAIGLEHPRDLAVETTDIVLGVAVNLTLESHNLFIRFHVSELVVVSDTRQIATSYRITSICASVYRTCIR